MYVISSDDTIVPLLGANIVKLGLADASDLLLDKRFVVIHDPSRDAKTAVTARTHDAVCRLFLLSYGHGLIREFRDKNFGPERDFWYFMNFWDTLEGRRNETNLKKIRDDLDITDMFDWFGGGVRKWLQKDCELKEALKERVKSLVKKGAEDLVRPYDNSDWRGLVVQLVVAFEPNAPIREPGFKLYPQLQDWSASNENVGENEDNKTDKEEFPPNTFREYYMAFSDRYPRLKERKSTLFCWLH